MLSNRKRGIGEWLKVSFGSRVEFTPEQRLWYGWDLARSKHMCFSPDGVSSKAALSFASCTVRSGRRAAVTTFALVSLCLGGGCASDSGAEPKDRDAAAAGHGDADQSSSGALDGRAATDAAVDDARPAGVDGGSFPDEDAGMDSGSSPGEDAGMDAANETDSAVRDAGRDASPAADSAPEAAADASPDSAADASPDSAADATSDSAVDVGQDGADAASDAEPSDVAIPDTGSETDDAGEACEDENPDTEDFLHPIYGCGHKWDHDPEDDEAWIDFDSGLSVDVATGMGWSPIVYNKTWDYFAGHCNTLSLAGLESWSFATIDDLRTLTEGCADNEPGGSCPLEDPSCLDLACGTGDNCSPCVGSGGPNDGDYCKIDVATCTNLWSASTCGDCGDGQTVWGFISANGYFFRREPDSAFHGRCVVEAVPDL